MAANKRTPIQIDRDRHEIAGLYLSGVPQHEIADKLNRRRLKEFDEAMKRGEQDPAIPYDLTRQMIGYDLDEIRKGWRGSALFDFNEAKGRELAKIDRVEQVAWAAWEGTLGFRDKEIRQAIDIEVTVTETPPEGFNDDDYPRRWLKTAKVPGVKKTHKKERVGLLGDPRYLLIINQCIERRCKILGFDVPDPNGGAGAGEPKKLYGGIDVERV